MTTEDDNLLLYEREVTGSEIALMAEDGHVTLPDGMQIRGITPCTLLWLKKVGSPIYGTIIEGKPFDSSDLEALYLFAYIHCAPWDELRALFARYDYSKELLLERVYDFANVMNPEALSHIVQKVSTDSQLTRSAMVKGRPDNAPKKAQQNGRQSARRSKS